MGLLLLALYVVLLARNDIDALMGGGGLPALPGGWKALAGGLALAIVVLLGARVWPLRVHVAAPRASTANLSLLAISLITLGALALRVYGISDNLPYTNYPDEPAVADRALHILQTGDYNPHYFVYPNLYTYMQAAVYLLRFFALVSNGSLQDVAGIVPTDFYLWGRLLTALLGALTVPLVYLTGRRLYGTGVGLAASVFMSVNSVHLVHSQLITTDVPATFFSALALLMTVRLLPAAVLHSGQAASSRVGPASAGRYALAGAAMGLAVGAKYNSALVALPFLLAHAYACVEQPGMWTVRLGRFFGGRLWLALGSMLLAFLLSTPFALFDLPNFLNDVASVVAHYRFGHAGHEGDSNWLYYVTSFLRSDLWPTLLTLAGVTMAFARHRRADVLLLAFPVAFYFSMSSYRVNFERNLLPILPFTSILAALPVALGLAYAQQAAHRLALSQARLRRTQYTWLPLSAALLVAVAASPATVAALQRGYRQSQPDNRVRASQWLDANTEPGAKVWLEPVTPDLDPSRYLTARGDHVTDHPLDWYRANRYEYLVLSGGVYKDIVYDHPEQNPALREAYQRFFSENEKRLAAGFESNKTDHPGPTILIYRTGYTAPATPADVHAEHPVGALFHENAANGAGGVTVQLVGADYPEAIKAGASLPLTLYWSADAGLSKDYTVFVHLVNEQGDVVAQRDTGPRDGTYPTSQWRAGEVVVDEAALDLSASLPAGSYTMRVGLYLQSGGQAVSAFSVTGGPPGSSPGYALMGPLTVEAAEK